MPPPTPTVWTVRALLVWTTDFLKTKGVEAAKLEAELLLAHVLQTDRTYLTMRFDEEPTDAERAKYKELITRRLAGWPVAYLVGSRGFYLLNFDVDPAVLIPRSDTETLVGEALKRLKPLTAPAVLDIGTGSGCIAVSLAHQKKDSHVTATDVSPDALAVAKRNAIKNNVADRMTFLQGDLFAPLPAGVTFDLVVSNPPYIAQSEFAELAPDVRDHEPRVALDGGPDGLAFYRRIAAAVGPFLKPGGSLLLEIGWKQDAAVRALIAEQPELELGPTIKDMGKNPRVVTAKKK
ncbi:Release factor glutamine methyltransferase [Gemmata obscuriglobus]|uniref:Release factor glutamine methyltransferase n=1 Tax=Gemmata obscuriglobus TaxID=114 RepID=A0A2Z3H7D0_9BACT|nr:peptide chain release factor N(5)-glutamine methyltransferase [Gemmata obscuriglobus]AWM36910.1 peptide chain release factor N(5)-glutamine methyltransferase [Gemmata obscuriglobus]QEG30414.1 Release factor glutamine methyltransferase [Gemmata obscuriglobus]VTS09738.1 modification methylase : Release factor glutamine methyltransferase OS=uncultured planctomycete GN=prmC PE=3 SV=1: Methyltransf_26 [Gemmata obscuriglobus UQM 2246]